MPFVRKTDSQGSQPPTDARKLFIGRTGELLFFVQNILKTEEPTHNIISILAEHYYQWCREVKWTLILQVW